MPENGEFHGEDAVRRLLPLRILLKGCRLTWTRRGKLKQEAALELRLDKIRTPLMRTRANDPNKVQELMDNIRLIGLQVPIDVLEVDGVYYGLFPDADSLSFLIICIQDFQHLATVKDDDRLYFVVPQAYSAVISMKLISASASRPSVAKFAREQRSP